MPLNHSVGGNWHSGHKDTCVKCGYKPPVPKVEVKPVVKIEAKKEFKSEKPKTKFKRKVSNARI